MAFELSAHARFQRVGLSKLAFAVMLSSSGCSSDLTDPSASLNSDDPHAMISPGGQEDLPAGLDPGRVGLHRLNNTEYNNTLRDLLGVQEQPALGFLAEQSHGFDNIASALGMTAAQYEAYFNAANSVVQATFADPTLRAALSACTLTDPSCAEQAIRQLGLRAFRRPLSEADVSALLGVYSADFAGSGDAEAALALALRAMLSSAKFLYRIELSPDPNSTMPHPLDGYELASRLSYLHWSSMPDAELFQLAEQGALGDVVLLETKLDRLLYDARGSAFTESFAGQWLALRDLWSHAVADQVFSSWSESLRTAMIGEGQAWFDEFLHGDRPLSEWFTLDVNFVNDELAAHYGLGLPGSVELTRVETPGDGRLGFLGLAGFLTKTSFPSRTSPTLRGVWILSNLMCSEPPPPPPIDIPDLEQAGAEDAAGVTNVRERLELHRQEPACAACHALLDPMGLGLENFDGIGAYRTQYENGDVIDPAGVLPDGQAFTGLGELSQILSQDPRLFECVQDKLFTYAVGRGQLAGDAVFLDGIHQRWGTRGRTLRNLLKEIVVSEPFRYSRGEAL